ncbi:MAG: hypothetical protein OXC64_00390, partial [Flavobacteriaceae bacterium]|nr:hypothetical protein [Flavobacteriaceae bacterium]
MSQEDIDKLKADLQTTLAAAQKTALDTALASLQAKLTELEQALADAANDALAQADLDQLREEIESELAEVKKDLEESLGDGGFYQGDTTIRSSREWDNTKRGQADYTAFSGDVTINTTNLEASEVDELIDWVGKITVINGDLTIIHAGSEKVVKLAQLSSVGDLDDSQLHVHYPELISAGTITLDDDIKTVKLPKLTTLEAFAGHTIDLDKGTELTLTALASYDADLKIDLDGTGAVIDLSALKVLGKADLTIIGPDEVSLPELTTLALLHVKDVRTVTAPKVKAANLRISEDVVSVNVGTEAGAHINTLTFTEANDLETLQIGGNPAAANKGGTVVALNAGTTPDLERAHIHGGFSVVVNGLDDFEEIITARTITSEVSLIGTALEGDVALGHASGANGILTVEHNTDIESLKADKVNKLKGLYIKGNHDLEEVSFDSFKVPGKQTIGGQNWWDGDGFAIGKAGYGAYNDSADNLNDNKNNLIAKEITQEILKSDKSVDRAGNIVDETGLSDLEDVLKHADTKRAVISFDGTEAFKGQSKTAEAVELQTTEANHEHLILFRKGTADIEGTKAGAKRVFLVDTDKTSGFTADGEEDLRIG